jgi:hypothetical protein
MHMHGYTTGAFWSYTDLRLRNAESAVTRRGGQRRSAASHLGSA